MNSYFTIATVALLLGGCAATTSSRQPVTLFAPFSEAEARAMLADGSNTIRGSAFIRQRGGGVVTCAGSTVNLIPATAYARERMRAIYGETRIAYATPQFVPDFPAYRALTKSTRCNAQGGFSFERLSDGDYFVVTSVRWQVGNLSEGGAVYAPVTVRGGQTVEIAVAP